MLLEQGGDPEAKDKGGWTPLIYAAYGGNLECVKAILETGASKKTKDKHKHTAYDWAMCVGRAARRPPAPTAERAQVHPQEAQVEEARRVRGLPRGVQAQARDQKADRLSSSFLFCVV
jgi:hypothetical protein